ncbi:MAG: hypothetical protein P1V51_10715 [Deltaproteobacteria bacterium]|nr:hypothetical protein [Deltaproteobacteria bacterium]
MMRRLPPIALFLTALLAAPAAHAQWAPLGEEGEEETSLEEVDLGPAPARPEAAEGEREARPRGRRGLRPLGSVVMGIWALGSPKRESPALAPGLAGGGGVALGSLRLQAWGLASWHRRSTSVLTVRQILLAAQGSISVLLRLGEADLELGGLGGVALGSTLQRVEAGGVQTETSTSLRPVFGGRVQLAWPWTRAEPVVELQVLRRGWVTDVVLGFGFRWGGGE